MKKASFSTLFILSLFLFIACRSMPTNDSKSLLSENQTYGNLSQELMEAAKNQTPADSILKILADVSPDDLAKELSNDTRKKAFWINIYNAYISIFLRKNPKLYDKRGEFFSAKRMEIAGKTLSFDDVEHGIIRGSRSKYTLGLTKKIFVGKFERQFRVQKRDHRIHFALNCGAKSCPPVAIYDADRLEEQLDKSATLFLNSTSEYKAAENKVYVTALFSWFRGDFGWKRGVRKILQKEGIVPKDKKPSLSYTTYDWTIDLDNYVEL